jgi:phage terminase large subunit
VYADFINNYAINNIDDSFDYDPDLPVWTCWDLGFSDYTAIWFFQVKNNLVTFIDYFEDNGHETKYYADVLFKKPYNYTYCILPFDGFRNDMRGPPISSQLEAFGYRTTKVEGSAEQYGIDRARDLLKICRFNKSKCALGLEHLKLFHYKINSRTGEKMSITSHDINSHAADAFRYVAMSKDIWSSVMQPGYVMSFVREDYNVMGY